MPICNKPPSAPAGSKTANEIDDHASEAAKMKRTREQAYFNSYEFDAIEVLPNEAPEKEEGEDGKDDEIIRVAADYDAARGHHRRQQQPPPPYSQPRPPPAPLLPPSLRRPSGTTLDASHRNASTSRLQALRTLSSSHSPNNRRRVAADASLSSKDDTTASSRSATPDRMEHEGQGEYRREYSYLQQLDAFLVQSRQMSETPSPSIAAIAKAKGPKTGQHQQPQQQQPQQRLHVASVGDKKTEKGNFLLPRAMLKYPSSSTNSMPSAVIATTITPPTPPPATTTTLPTLGSTSNSLLASSINGNSSNSTGLRPPPSSSSNISSSSSGGKNRQHQIHANSNEPKGTGSSTLTSHKKSSASMTASMAKSSASALNATEIELANELVLRNGQKSQPAVATKMAKTSTVAATTTATKTGSTPAADADADAPNHGEPHECSGSHQSHYSTDKSGSSGYYSSNVCSTYSIEDHIYCEPVIDVLELSSNSKSKSGPGAHNSNCNNIRNSITSSKSRKQLLALQGSVITSSSSNSKSSLDLQTGGPSAKLRSQNRNRNHSRSGMKNKRGISQMERVAAVNDGECDDDDDDDDERNVVNMADRTPVSPVHLRNLKINPLLSVASAPSHLNENLRILETSIETLDRHLKTFQCLGSQEHVTAFMQAHHSFQPQQLPTIMEGYDSASYELESNKKPLPRPQWQDGSELVDDSLLDIDFDSFLLANESAAEKNSSDSNKRGKLHQASETPIGIENPSFLHPATDELEENNYKCAKYINSCPEDAYRVESDIVVGGSSASQKSNCMEHYLRRYEDQLHFQSTRELLEDVRDKIRLLSRSSSESDHDLAACHDELPLELNDMIKKLKHELETYLARMNQHSELEIRQLCSGLVKNQHIVKMKKAFQHRRSTASLSALDSEYDFSAYEALRDGVFDSASGMTRGMQIDTHQVVSSIRCISDPNFKMKRKSLAEVFPDATDIYSAGAADGHGALDPKPRVSGCQENSAAASADPLAAAPRTQLQRNLSFLQPTLNQLDANVGGGPSGMAAGNAVSTNNANAGSRGSASGGDSGEKDAITEWHRKKPSAWELYYGTNRMNQSLLGKRGLTVNYNQPSLSYPSSRPESDFTLDLPRAEQLRVKMEKEKKFRQRCRYITSFLSLVFFLLTVMVVSLVLTRGKRMFGSMI